MAELDDDPTDFDLDVLENEFFEQFMSPDDQLLSDDADDPDTVPVTEHSSLDAVRQVFEDRLSEEQLEELAADLDLTSATWMSIEEFRAANSEAEIDDLDLDDDED